MLAKAVRYEAGNVGDSSHPRVHGSRLYVPFCYPSVCTEHSLPLPLSQTHPWMSVESSVTRAAALNPESCVLSLPNTLRVVLG